MGLAGTAIIYAAIGLCVASALTLRSERPGAALTLLRWIRRPLIGGHAAGPEDRRWSTAA